MSASRSCPIPGCRDRLSDSYSTTPGGTLCATTPGALGHELLHWQTGFCHVETEGNRKNRAGLFEDTVGHFLMGTRIIYDRKFLLECKNSPIARTPPYCLPQIPGVTIPPVPPSRLELLKEQKQTEEETTDDEQFEMDM